MAELQHRLGRLGFDCGRVDGIFGPRTAHALQDFQANSGLPADAVCGTETSRSIDRVIGQTGSGPGVGAVREREQMRRGYGTLKDCRIALGQYGGMSALTRVIARELRHQGASVMSLDEPDPVAQAHASNHFQAHVYLGLEAIVEPQVVAHFYQVPTFESVGGHQLASALADRLAYLDGLTSDARGMRLPILRETRMPAVLLCIGPIKTALSAAPMVNAACIEALTLWVTSR